MADAFIRTMLSPNWKHAVVYLSKDFIPGKTLGVMGWLIDAHQTDVEERTYLAGGPTQRGNEFDYEFRGENASATFWGVDEVFVRWEGGTWKVYDVEPGRSRVTLKATSAATQQFCSDLVGVSSKLRADVSSGVNLVVTVQEDSSEAVALLSGDAEGMKGSVEHSAALDVIRDLQVVAESAPGASAILGAIQQLSIDESGFVDLYCS